MSHLNLETLARLLDDAPDPTEAGHLDICAQCRDELEAMRADAAALRGLPDPEPPIAAWLALEQTLQREGLMRKNPWATQLLRLAAVLVIFVLGSVAGALFVRQQMTRAVATATPVRNSNGGTLVRDPLQLDTQPSAPSHVVATATPLNAPPRPAANAEEAAARLRDAENAYVSALSRYSDFTTRAQDTGDPVARLAALESIVATTRAALGQAPADPIINGYHLTAVAQRDATLRQIAASKQQTWY
jgi:hypothetical protein